MKVVAIAIGVLVAAGIGYLIVQSYPDIQRYMRIRSM